MAGTRTEERTRRERARIRGLGEERSFWKELMERRASSRQEEFQSL